MLTSPGSRIGRNRWSGSYSAIAPPITKLRRAANQAITNATWTPISWDTIVRDDVAAFNIATPTTVYVPPPFSKIEVVLFTAWANNGSGLRMCTMDANGLTGALDFRNANGESCGCWGSQLIDVKPRDPLIFYVHQTSGGTLNLSGTGFPSTGTIAEIRWFK